MLDEKYVTKALNELKETEETRNATLNQFRSWISKHDFFKNCRQDDKFLLQFLRTKKFDMARSTDLFERFMLMKSTYPKWFDYDDNEEDRMWKLFDTGFVYPLAERDADGRRVILVQVQKLDYKIHSFADILRLITIIAQILLEEEETQISGVIVITDFSNINLSHLRIFPLTDVISFVEVLQTCAVGRHKKMIFVALPSFATWILETAKRVMNEKLKSRIKIVRSFNDVEEDIERALLPLEFGGNISESVIMDKFRMIVAERNPTIKDIPNGVDWDKVALEGDKDSCTIA